MDRYTRCSCGEDTMSWEDVIKNEKVEIDSWPYEYPEGSFFSKYDKLRMRAMYKLLERHYPAQAIEGELKDMMERLQ